VGGYGEVGWVSVWWGSFPGPAKARCEGRDSSCLAALARRNDKGYGADGFGVFGIEILCG